MFSQYQPKIKTNSNNSTILTISKNTRNACNTNALPEKNESFTSHLYSENFPSLNKNIAKKNKNKPRKSEQLISLEISKIDNNISNENCNEAVSHGQSFPKLKHVTEKNNDNSLSTKKSSTFSVPEILNNQSPENTASKKSISNVVISEKSMLEPKKLVTVHLNKNPYMKKRTDPIYFNLEDGLQKNKKLHRVENIKSYKGKFHKKLLEDKLSGNTLDSSNPIRSKGKHREVKKKHLSSLKSLVIKERIMKKIYFENINSYPAGFINEFSQIAQGIDFKSEVEKYLKEFPNRKADKLKNKTEGLKESNKSNNKSCYERKSNTIQPGVRIELKAPSTLNQKPQIIDQATKTHNVSSNKNIFSAKMKEYCHNFITPELNTAVSELIKGLVNFQDRAYFRDPIKAKGKKRHVSGLKEAKKYVTAKKVKMIVIPHDLENLLMQGSINDQVNKLKVLAESQNVPCVFALNRYHLGRCAKKFVPVSAFAVLNYDGLEVQYENVLNRWKDARKKFEEKITSRNETESEVGKINNKIISTVVAAFQEELSLTGDDSCVLKKEKKSKN